MAGSTASVATNGDLVLTRFFQAPRELVFQAWSEPEHFSRWFGPHGSTVPFCTMDFRPGGVLRFCHRLPSGEEVWARGMYREILEPERLVFTDSFSDAAGNVVERPGYPRETLVTVTFTEHEGGTELLVRHTGLTAEYGELQGWAETLDRLAVFLLQV